MLIRTHTIEVGCRLPSISVCTCTASAIYVVVDSSKHLPWIYVDIRTLYRFAAIFPRHKIPDNKIIKRIESIFITTVTTSAWHIFKQTANNAPFNHQHRPHHHHHQILTQTRLLIYLFEIRSQPMVGTTMASPAVRKYIYGCRYWVIGCWACDGKTISTKEANASYTGCRRRRCARCTHTMVNGDDDADDGEQRCTHVQHVNGVVLRVQFSC